MMENFGDQNSISFDATFGMNQSKVSLPLLLRKLQ
jgi:hypothetical protein